MTKESTKEPMTIFIRKADSPDVVRRFDNVVDIFKDKDNSVQFSHIEDGIRINRVMLNVIAMESN